MISKENCDKQFEHQHDLGSWLRIAKSKQKLTNLRNPVELKRAAGKLNFVIHIQFALPKVQAKREKHSFELNILTSIRFDFQMRFGLCKAMSSSNVRFGVVV